MIAQATDNVPYGKWCMSSDLKIAHQFLFFTVDMKDTPFNNNLTISVIILSNIFLSKTRVAVQRNVKKKASVSRGSLQNKKKVLFKLLLEY